MPASAPKNTKQIMNQSLLTYENNEHTTEIEFLKELFNISNDVCESTKIEHIKNSHPHYNLYIFSKLVLWIDFNGEILQIAKPQNMNVKKKFYVNDKSISDIRKCMEDIWVENYIKLSEDYQ